MKYFLLLAFVHFSQLLTAQFDITPLTGFSFKSSRKQVMEKVSGLGGYVPESIREEKSLGVKGIKMLGYVNDFVIFSFYQDQLYNIGFTIPIKNTPEQKKILDNITELLIDNFGQPLSLPGNHTLWLAEKTNPDADKIIVSHKDNDEIMIQFTDGYLLNLAKPELKPKALRELMQR